MRAKAYTEDNQRIWCIRAGIDGEAHSWFMDKMVVCLADQGMGNLRKIPADRQAFYGTYRTLHPSESASGTAGIGGKFFRFIHEIHNGDLIVYHSLSEARIYVGIVMGEYTYSRKQDEAFPHQRSVKWLCNFSKSRLSEKSRRELGAARTLFEIKHYREEIMGLVRQSTSPDAANRP